MKNIMITVVLGALVACSVPAAAQQDNAWSTGGVAGSGSAYSSQVTPVGATAPDEMATTTYSNQSSNARRGNARRDIEHNTDAGITDDNGSPIGTPLALLTFAAVGAGVVLKRKKE